MGNHYNILDGSIEKKEREEKEKREEEIRLAKEKTESRRWYIGYITAAILGVAAIITAILIGS